MVATSFGFVDASLESYQAAYIFSPQIKNLRDLVAKGQQAFEAAVLQSVPEKKVDAVSAVEGFHDLCQIDAIAALVNQAVNAGKLEAFVGGGASFARLVNEAARLQMAQAVGAISLSDELLLRLYWFASGQASAADRKEMAAEFSVLPKNPLKPDGSDRTAPPPPVADWKEMASATTAIRQTAGGALDAEIKRRQVAKQAAVAAGEEADAAEKRARDLRQVAILEADPQKKRAAEVEAVNASVDAAKARNRALIAAAMTSRPFTVPIVKVVDPY